MPKPKKTKTLPTAPIASEVYKGGSYRPAPDRTTLSLGWGYDPHYKYRFAEVVTAPIKNKSTLFKTTPRVISKEILYYTNPEGRLVTDTAYVERPEYTNYYPIKVLLRYGSTNDKNRDEYNVLLRRFNEAKSTVLHQQGGIMNKIKYFQQGGAAPQQDMQQQVVALVQAAMLGDEKATQTVNKIMEAAKAGDQQAMQLAQMIQQVAKQMQGLATAAKWGARLNYIKSLKLANGGKTCPTCQAGAPIPQDKAYIKPTKKVEMKACGGKKAKKRYFGGLI